MTLRDEVTLLLQELIRANTVNPPGNETIAAELLRDYLERNGVRCELVGRSARAAQPRRAAARAATALRSRCSAHTDTVRADPGEWTRDPWSGDLVDGEIWGRGALDMKSQVAASAVAVALARPRGLPARRGCGPALTADEEVNENYGLSWLVRRASRARARRLLAQRGCAATAASSAARSSTSAPSARR